MCPPLITDYSAMCLFADKKLPVFVYEGALEYMCPPLFECFPCPCNHYIFLIRPIFLCIYMKEQNGGVGLLQLMFDIH